MPCVISQHFLSAVT